MDQAVRNKLRSAVTQCRKLLEEAIANELEGKFVIYAKKDKVTADPNAKTDHLTAAELAARVDLLEHFAHIASRGNQPREALEQMIREIAFTHLNRFCAYKMMEARQVYVGGQKFREAVSRGIQSNGVKFYLADHPEDERLFKSGQQDLAYRNFLDWLGGTLSEEIGVLFNPDDSANRIYPPQRVLDAVLALINDEELKDIWSQDETIGWVYQYFTPKELRDQVHKESRVPRNSYELAFRNQFFTPRYVVEFLTDNTLGRIWYETTNGQTGLKEYCRYLVRRPDEVFLASDEQADKETKAMLKCLTEGDEESFAPFTADSDKEIQRMIVLAHCVNGYSRHHTMPAYGEWEQCFREKVLEPQTFDGVPTQDILDALFYICRADRHGGDGSVYSDPWFAAACNEVRRRVLEGRRDDASQEELLKSPVFVPYRAIKDPREIKVLDPACGSGHFLLYCFDLLLTIYEEAYADQELGPAIKRDYPTLDALRRAIPGLILKHNLHGIDIDLRATQIAALALWLRCQRAYQELGLKSDERPKITRSNIVCAEPMPGEEQMLKEFVVQLEPKLLGQVVEVVFDKMKLAGEAGSLLKIEEEIQNSVAGAKKQYVRERTQATDRKGQPLLFTQVVMDRLAGKLEQPSPFDLTDITDNQFFEQAEAKVIEALRQYAEKAHNNQRLQRRLFTEDAVRGFAFVDLCQKRYDVVLMNPPFGDSSKPAKQIIEAQYPRTKNDLYASFVERGILLLRNAGYLGAITSRTGLFLSSFQKWREDILLGDASPTVVVDLGSGVLDTAMVETAAYCVTARKTNTACAFFRLLNHGEKDAGLRIALAATSLGNTTEDVFYVLSESFKQVPGAPFFYWVTERVRRLFRQLPPLESDGRENRVGLQTSDNFRFLRCWWEVPPTLLRSKWVPYAKGGGYSPYYRDQTLCVNWSDSGAEIKDFARTLGNSPSRSVRSEDHYFRSALTYSDRCTGGFATSPLPSGAIFDVKGSCIFVEADDENELLRVLAITLSNPFRKLMALRSGTHSLAQSFQVGQISSTPYPTLDGENAVHLQTLAANAHFTKREILRQSETDHTFTCIRLPRENGFHAESLMLDDQIRGQVQELNHIQEELDVEVARLYSLPEADLAQLLDVANTVATKVSVDVTSDSEEEDQITSPTSDGLVRSVIQWIVGVVFGRWDLRKSFGESGDLPGPFAQLPVCALGMLQGDDGLPVHQPPQDYPLCIDSDGILADDADTKDDIIQRNRVVFELIWDKRSEIVEDEACEILGVTSLRDYFRKPGKGGFWDDHVSHYSKSRRKAPIYWYLRSSKGNYGLWLYYHRLDKDILFKALLNYVEPKLRLEEDRLKTLRGKKESAGNSGREAKQIEEDIDHQEEFISELHDFKDKLKRAADLHLTPDLNDGVVLNIAPLWELVPWKVAKEYWDELIDGKYEWSSIGKQLREKGLVKQ